MARDEDAATPPFRYDLRQRRAAAAARRAIRRLGITSAEQLRRTPRADLLRVLPPTAYDYVNDALNRGDDERLRDVAGD